MNAQSPTGLPKFCPYCKVSFKAKLIPKKDSKHYGKETHFNRVIGIVDPDKDRVIFWKCQDCNQEWER